MRLSDMIVRYPYCATYRLLRAIALANVHSTTLPAELKTAAIHLPDRTQLFQLVNNGEYEWVNLMQQLDKRSKEKAGTEINDFLLIDQYLDHIHTPETRVKTSGYEISLENLPNLPIDYDEEAEQDADGPIDDTFSLIDSFIQAEQEGTLFTPLAKPKEEEKDREENLEKIRDRVLLSESLAKVYVKQHKYEQALAIFSQLNLDNSKKNHYFADQIRFLEKVIAYKNGTEDALPRGSQSEGN